MTEPISDDWLSPPGDTIEDLLEERGWTKGELAERLGRTPKYVSELVGGAAPISAETAAKLSRVLGSSPKFWLEREAHYRAALERKKELTPSAEASSWLRDLPLKWLQAEGLVPSSAQGGQLIQACLRYFGVADVSAWKRVYGKPMTAFRSSSTFKKCPGAVAAWLRRAELSATDIRGGTWNANGFKAALVQLRPLTTEEEPTVFVEKLTEACAKFGVAVVFVPAPPGCPVSGATRWLTPEKAMLALSLRHKSNDHLWFTFFHECGHLLRHGKKLEFIEGMDGLDRALEEEANSFARDLLIPPSLAPELPSLRRSASVVEFAARAGVHPGIVVGRLQHDHHIGYQTLNGLKQRYVWAKSG